jgi:hypothetical protein
VEPGGKHKKLGSDGDNRRNVAGFNIIFIYIIYLNIYFVMLCASNVVMTLGKMVRRDCPKYTTGYDRSSKFSQSQIDQEEYQVVSPRLNQDFGCGFCNPRQSESGPSVHDVPRQEC